MSKLAFFPPRLFFSRVLMVPPPRGQRSLFLSPVILSTAQHLLVAAGAHTLPDGQLDILRAENVNPQSKDTGNPIILQRTEEKVSTHLPLFHRFTQGHFLILSGDTLDMKTWFCCFSESRFYFIFFNLLGV